MFENTNKPFTTLVAKSYEIVFHLFEDADTFIKANAPDYKSAKRAATILEECAHTEDPHANGVEVVRDMLYNLSGAFEEMADSANLKAKGAFITQYVKHTKRSLFYRQIADWAMESFSLMDGDQSPQPAKDAEDDSDPYISPSPLNDTWKKIEAALRDGVYTMPEIAHARIVFDDAVEAVWKHPGTGDDMCRVLEKFGDECASIDCAPTSDRLWGACVLISDDLRASTYATQTKPMPIITSTSDGFETDIAMWEVAGDVSRSLCRTKADAEAWARVLFPNEAVNRRYARIQSRTVITKK